MQQECASFVFGEATVFRDQDEIRLEVYDGLEGCKPAGFDPEISGGVGKPVLASNELVRLSRPVTQPRRDIASTR